MAIQQHPLPQDISSYRFRLIGDMTIKQFASLAISIILSLITYSLPLPFFFKYPLAFIFFALGIGMAFVPVQGRTLDVWILNFIRSIYTPTQYVWKKSKEVSEEASLPTVPNQVVPASTTRQVEMSKPSTPVVAVTPVGADTAQKETMQTPTITPTPTQQSTTQTVSAPKPAPTPTPLTAVPSTPIPNVTTHTPQARPIVQPPVAAPPQQVSTPRPSADTVPAYSAAPASVQLPVPFTPSTPNTLVGLTLTPDGKILDGVLVEIQKNGITSRATKSNKLGQFMFARPLENGNIQILAEKDDFTFPPYTLELKGEIVRPLKIQAES